MARQIDARGIPWWRALVLYPFLLGPWILVKGAATALWMGVQRAPGKWRERSGERRPPEPTGLGLFVLTFLFAGGVLAIALAAKGVADRVAAMGLLLVTLATVFVSPALFSLDALAKLDEWWLATELPRYQVAFAHHIRRIIRPGLRLALTAVSVIFVLGAAGVALNLPTLGLLVWPFCISVTAALGAGVLRLILGLPSEGPPEPVVTAPVSELERDSDRQRHNARLAAAFFLTGTLLSFVAVVFLH